MLGLLVIALVFAPIIITIVVRRTRWFVVPGGLLVVVGIVLLASAPWGSTGLAAMGMGPIILGAIAALLYGAICLTIGIVSHRRAKRGERDQRSRTAP